MTLPSDEFYRLAERLPAYQGVVRARLVIEYEKLTGERPNVQEPVQIVETPMSAAAAASDPAMPGSIEVD